MSKLLTKITNTGPRRFIAYLPPNGRTLEQDETVLVDGFLDTALSLTKVGQTDALAADEADELVEISYLFGDRALKAVAAPTEDDDLVTKEYVDDAFSSVDIPSLPSLAEALELNDLLLVYNSSDAADNKLTVQQLMNTIATKGFSNLKIVSKTGGPFVSIQAAIDSISDASAVNHYTVLVLPGLYSENIVCKDYVHLFGLGGTEYGTASPMIEADNDLITTAASVVSNFRLTLTTTGSGTRRVINGQNSVSRFTLDNCYIIVFGNYGADDVYIAQQHGVHDLYFTKVSCYFRPTTSGDTYGFNSVSGTCNAHLLYMNHYAPTAAHTTFWKKEGALNFDEIQSVHFREHPNAATDTMFKNIGSGGLQVNGAFGLRAFTAGVWTSNTGGGTLTVDDLSPMTVKGDLSAYDGSRQSRIPVGTDGQVLVADSGETAGVKWSAFSPSGFQFVFLSDATGGVPTGKLCYTNGDPGSSYLIFPTAARIDAQGRDLTSILAGLVAGTRFRISSPDGSRGRYGFLRTAIGASPDVIFGNGAGLVTEIVHLQADGDFDFTDGDPLTIEFFGNVESVAITADAAYDVQHEDHKVIFVGSSSCNVTLPDPAKNKNREITVIATDDFGTRVVTVLTAASTIRGPITLTSPASCSYCSDGSRWVAFGWTAGAV